MVERNRWDCVDVRDRDEILSLVYDGSCMDSREVIENFLGPSEFIFFGVMPEQDASDMDEF